MLWSTRPCADIQQGTVAQVEYLSASKEESLAILACIAHELVPVACDTSAPLLVLGNEQLNIDTDELVTKLLVAGHPCAHELVEIIANKTLSPRVLMQACKKAAFFMNSADEKVILSRLYGTQLGFVRGVQMFNDDYFGKLVVEGKCLLERHKSDQSAAHQSHRSAKKKQTCFESKIVQQLRVDVLDLLDDDKIHKLCTFDAARLLASLTNDTSVFDKSDAEVKHDLRMIALGAHLARGNQVAVLQ